MQSEEIHMQKLIF